MKFKRRNKYFPKSMSAALRSRKFVQSLSVNTEALSKKIYKREGTLISQLTKLAAENYPTTKVVLYLHREFKLNLAWLVAEIGSPFCESNKTTIPQHSVATVLDRVNMLCSANNLSIWELCEQSGVIYSSFKNSLQIDEISPYDMEKLLYHFGINPNWLISGYLYAMPFIDGTDLTEGEGLSRLRRREDATLVLVSDGLANEGTGDYGHVIKQEPLTQEELIIKHLQEINFAVKEGEKMLALLKERQDVQFKELKNLLTELKNLKNEKNEKHYDAATRGDVPHGSAHTDD